MLPQTTQNEVHYLGLTSAGPSHNGVKVNDQRSLSAIYSSNALIVACSMPAHAHVDVPFQYLSCDLGLHNKQSGWVVGGSISLTISNGGT